MCKISKERLLELSNGFMGKKIAIIGDMMLDGYFWGVVKRISPEAPVPVVEIDNEFFRFGGAANVALNVQKLTGSPLAVGVIGDDNDGITFKSLMDEAGLSQEGIFIDKTRPTTTKTRVISDNQQIVRIDKESKENINNEIQENIISCLRKNIKDIDAVILQDYNKGVLSKVLIHEIILLSNKFNKIVTVDPKFLNFKEYRNVTVFKPNIKETETILGMRIQTDADITNAGKEILKELNCKYALLTLGAKGIALFDKSGQETRIPTKARKVADVSGAGDTVISTLTIALAAGADIYEAAYLANYAGGLVCEEVGIVPIEKDHLFSTIIDN